MQAEAKSDTLVKMPEKSEHANMSWICEQCETGYMKAEVLAHTVATTQAEVKAKTLDNVVLNVEAPLSTH